MSTESKISAIPLDKPDPKKDGDDAAGAAKRGVPVPRPKPRDDR